MKANITVLMPVYNEENWVSPTISSILAQTYKNFDFWIIDDGSTDKTWQKIKSFKDSRIKAIHRDKNQGMTTCLNWAIPQIKTPFIARMDSHHLADKARLEKQYNYMIKNPSLMALGANYTRHTEDGKIIFQSHFPTAYSDIKNKLIERNVFRHASMMFRREIYDNVGLYDLYFKVAQDYDFILRVAGKFPVENLSDNLITEIYRSSNMTQRFRSRSAWEALCAQNNALTRYSYPIWQSIYLLRGLAFLGKSYLYQSGIIQ